MRVSRLPFALALALALLMHGLALVYWPANAPIAQTRSVLPGLQILLSLRAARMPNAESAVEAREPVLPQTLADAQPQDEPNFLPSDETRQASVVPKPEPGLPLNATASEPSRQIRHERTGSTLKLERPEDWRVFAPPASRADAHVQAFRPEFFEELEARRDAKTRHALVSQRLVAQHGLSVDDYNALERPGSRHVKTEKGCFNLQSDTAGEVAEGAGVGLRWYRVACKDLLNNPLHNPLQIPVWETDALGRAAR